MGRVLVLKESDKEGDSEWQYNYWSYKRRTENASDSRFQRNKPDELDSDICK